MNGSAIIIDIGDMMRPRHPKKEVEKAIQYAEKCGWYYRPSGRAAHSWGKLFCPHKGQGSCKVLWLWSTPKSADIHARKILHKVNHCPHWRLIK